MPSLEIDNLSKAYKILEKFYQDVGPRLHVDDGRAIIQTMRLLAHTCWSGDPVVRFHL